MIYILVILAGSPMSIATVPGFGDRAQCESAGEAWKVEAKREYNARYYCVAGPEKRALTLRP
jgi:hypothetical protein